MFGVLYLLRASRSGMAWGSDGRCPRNFAMSRMKGSRHSQNDLTRDHRWKFKHSILYTRCVTDEIHLRVGDFS